MAAEFSIVTIFGLGAPDAREKVPPAAPWLPSAKMPVQAIQRLERERVKVC